MSRFIDGAPLDASILASLETQINELKKDKVEVGLVNSTIKKQIQSGSLGPKKFKSEKSTTTTSPAFFDITFDQQFEIPPTVVVSLVSPQGGLVDDNIRLAVGDVTNSGARVWVYFQTTSAKGGQVKPLSINYIAMTS